MIRYFLTFVVLAGLAVAQSAPEKPIDAYVKVINASEVTLPQPWRAGVNLSFKDNELVSDIRPGERCPYRKITFTGKDFVVLRMTEGKEDVVRVPANFEKGAFYTLIVTGMVSKAGPELKAIGRNDFPENPAQVRSTMARVNVINAISSFPISFAAGDSQLRPAAFGVPADKILPPGEQALKWSFNDHKGRPQSRTDAILLEAAQSYTIILRNSTEGGNRPVLFKSSESKEIRDLLARDKEAVDQREEPNPPGG